MRVNVIPFVFLVVINDFLRSKKEEDKRSKVVGKKWFQVAGDVIETEKSEFLNDFLFLAGVLYYRVDVPGLSWTGFRRYYPVTFPFRDLILN